MSSTAEDVLEGRAQYALLQADMRELLPSLPDESTQLIATDPPYDRSAHWMYFFLHEQAARLLKPGGHYVVIAPQYLLCPFNSQLRAEIPEGWVPPSLLKLRWAVQMRQETGPHARLVNPNRNLEVCGKIVLWYTKHYLPENDYRGIRDAFDSYPISKEDRLHKWQQSKQWAEFCLRLMPPDGSGVVLDPLMGAGTLPILAMQRGYQVIGADIDREAVKIAQDRAAREVL